MLNEPAAVRLKYTDEEFRELCFQAEVSFSIELQRRENLYTDLSIRRLALHEEFKSLKAEEKAALESLQSFKADGPDYPENPEFKDCVNQEEDSAESSPLDVSEDRYQRYRALPLLPIVKNIKGLGSSKLSTLVDQYPTVGALLDLRKEKGLEWFKAIGKGFGPELGSRIEEAADEALAGLNNAVQSKRIEVSPQDRNRRRLG